MGVNRGHLVIAAIALAAAACHADDTDRELDLGEQAAIGRELVQQRGCPSCHQSEDRAAGVLSGRTQPLPGTEAYPANLTPDPATGLGNWPDIEIVRAMRFGVDRAQAPLCPPMPRFDGTDPSQPFMTDVEADAILAYLRSLPPVARALPASQCPPIKPPPPVDMAAPPVDMAAPQPGTPDMTPPHD